MTALAILGLDTSTSRTSRERSTTIDLPTPSATNRAAGSPAAKCTEPVGVSSAVFAAMLELHETDRKIDHLTVAETLRQQGKLEQVGGPEAIDELAGWVPAAGHAREYGRIVRDNAQMRALLTASYEIQASVVSREAPARDLVERAERSMLEVAHDDRQKKIRSIADILHEETDKLHRL